MVVVMAPEASKADTEAVVDLVRYDASLVNVPVPRGENAGRTLQHANVVRQVVRLGHLEQGEGSFKLSLPSQESERIAVLVAEHEGGPILAAARI